MTREATLLGYNTRNKTMILGTYLLIPLVNLVWSGAYTLEALRPLAVSRGVSVVPVDRAGRRRARRPSRVGPRAAPGARLVREAQRPTRSPTSSPTLRASSGPPSTSAEARRGRR